MIYLNGKFMPIEEACIPVLDRGFIFGDGIYEVIPAYSRKPFRLAKHLNRLQHSLDGIRLKNPLSNTDWESLLEQVIAKNDGEDQYLYLHITRGVAKRDHAFPVNVPPTVFIMSNPLLPPPAELLISGASAITAIDNRWIRCDVKAISLLPNVLLRQLAVDVHAIETILIRDGFLTEGAASNIFVVKDNMLLAPPKSHLMLPGITYDVILELAAANQIAHEVREISEAEIRAADEILLTSSTKEIMPITLLDNKSVSNGKPGAMFTQLHTLYQQYKATHMRGNVPAGTKYL
ncbi:MAG: D-amino acid aminotransferase [Nitrosomonas sp.]|uniref:D-amino acid aminotransferase n=1 Tax=Nitrosomonas sp. TaxID=42353 RepID=UPI002732DE02|nr:D-amino acid aminotransferase [Nitrosomonas sp.]MDP1933740.1 D-amino acid aminotransferase [Nitrosomonas sp.]MDP3281267.1 D-amino acid aminotransferase [Nitrosomonas sp.]MDP3664973.1 D-amino acid aminotransferase [Nitrosomonas sp.]MDZ4107290.1 D-amino acid aminotransferase [Nitrosomonas sp.]